MGNGTKIIGEPEYSDITLNSDFNANTILKADDDNTPTPLTIEPNTLLGRGLSGDITDLDVSKQSFTNLIENGGFELWSAGADAAPDGWAGHDSPTIARSTTHKLGVYSQQLTASTNDSRTAYEFDHSTLGDYDNRVVTFGCWVYSTHGGTCICLQAGAVYVYSSYHSGGSTWEWLSVSLIGGSPTTKWCVLYPDKVSGTGIAYFDGAMLVEGSVCPAFSPKPVPLIQSAHIPDPAVSIAANNAAIDAILIALEKVGILASA